MEKLRHCDVMADSIRLLVSYLCYADRPACENALELHTTIHFFAALSRFITEIGRAATFWVYRWIPSLAHLRPRLRNTSPVRRCLARGP